MADLPQLTMKHPDLSKLPALILPERVTIHTEQADSETQWTEIIVDSFNSTGFTYEKTIRGSLGYRPEGVFFAALDGVDSATATAVEKDIHPGYGWIHMVGARSSARGHKLGYYTVLAALHDIRARGFDKAGLTTDDWRIPAIKTYLALGFEPWCEHESHPGRWEKIMAELNAKK